MTFNSPTASNECGFFRRDKFLARLGRRFGRADGGNLRHYSARGSGTRRTGFCSVGVPSLCHLRRHLEAPTVAKPPGRCAVGPAGHCCPDLCAIDDRALHLAHLYYNVCRRVASRAPEFRRGPFLSARRWRAGVTSTRYAVLWRHLSAHGRGSARLRSSVSVKL